MFFRKKRRRSQSSPPWVKWILGIVLGMIIIGNFNKESAVHQSVQKAADDLNPQKLLPGDDYKTKLFPGYGTTLRINDNAPGEGTAAVCGQRVKIAYQAFLENGTPLDDKAEKDNPLSFRIGEGKVMPAFEQGVTGMKQGGKRSLGAPPNLSYGIPGYTRSDVAANASVRFDIELLDISPSLSDLQLQPYRIATVKSGNGPAIECGEPARAHITLWDMEGKKLFSSYDGDRQPLTFTPGRSEVFLGLEQGVVGMQRGGVRTLIVPPSFQKTMDNNAPAIEFPLPKMQTVLVDIEAMP